MYSSSLHGITTVLERFYDCCYLVINYCKDESKKIFIVLKCLQLLKLILSSSLLQTGLYTVRHVDTKTGRVSLTSDNLPEQWTVITCRCFNHCKRHLCYVGFSNKTERGTVIFSTAFASSWCFGKALFGFLMDSVQSLLQKPQIRQINFWAKNSRKLVKIVNIFNLAVFSSHEQIKVFAPSVLCKSFLVQRTFVILPEQLNHSVAIPGCQNAPFRERVPIVLFKGDFHRFVYPILLYHCMERNVQCII